MYSTAICEVKNWTELLWFAINRNSDTLAMHPRNNGIMKQYTVTHVNKKDNLCFKLSPLRRYCFAWSLSSVAPSSWTTSGSSWRLSGVNINFKAFSLCCEILAYMCPHMDRDVSSTQREVCPQLTSRKEQQTLLPLYNISQVASSRQAKKADKLEPELAALINIFTGVPHCSTVDEVV